MQNIYLAFLALTFALDWLNAIITMTCVSRARNCIKLLELVKSKGASSLMQLALTFDQLLPFISQEQRSRAKVKAGLH
jgi:hypothetical protein